MFRASSETFADRPAILVLTGGGSRTVTYREYAAMVRRYCGALQSLGLKRGDTVSLMSENCIEWTTLDWACQCLGIVLTPIYPTLPADQAQYIVRNCEAKFAFGGSDELCKRLGDLPGVEVMLLRGAEDSLAALAEKCDMAVADWNASIDSIDPESLATLIYTSGTTGPPKGVMLPHKAPTWLCRQIIENLPVDHNDTFFSFLPLSHILERFAGHFLTVSCGATVAHSRGLAYLVADIAESKPTVVPAVPRFIDAMRERILDNVAKQSGLKQTLFRLARGQGSAKYHKKRALLHPLLDAIVLKKVRERFGGRIRFFVVGGAALSQESAEFFNAIGIMVRQGYGLTETTGPSNVNVTPDYRPWTVGPPITGIEMKLAPDGEILVRAPSVMTGYFKLPEDTAQVLDAEGWFHTGDIGEIEDGQYKITDRKKDILVLANGKNVAPQPIENKLKGIPFITEAVLFGDGSEYVYGLIIPNFERLEQHIASLGLKPPPRDQILELDAVKKLFKEEIDTVNKGLADFERLKRYTLVNATFSIESGELTPSMKVRRKVVREKYADALSGLVRS